MPSVHTVRSDFLEQDVKTTTQAERLDREVDASKEAAATARHHHHHHNTNKDKNKASRADAWLTSYFADLSDGSAGLSSYLGYRAWGLYEKGALDWKAAGVGVGIIAAVGAVESVVGGYLYKAKGKDSS
ncbi:hypothetical protein CP533_3734 [Ophiocordyceps camponoti-saundersi (nom. inval.)]|nr:hypothetical protein CP533_3734 [Ophiocordyceps camponoti-saundersi (nom. inval.)]